MLLVDISLDGTVCLSRALTGGDLEQFFACGKVTLPLSDPCLLGKAKIVRRGTFAGTYDCQPDPMLDTRWSCMIDLMNDQ